jgi:hypothetical protein
MAKDHETYPEESVVRLKKTGEFALIKKRVFLKEGKNFLHYEGPIEGRGPGNYAFYHQDVDLECLPPQ